MANNAQQTLTEIFPARWDKAQRAMTQEKSEPDKLARITPVADGRLRSEDFSR